MVIKGLIQKALLYPCNLQVSDILYDRFELDLVLQVMILFEDSD